MKPSAQLLYTYQRAREQALEECRLRQEAVYAASPGYGRSPRPAKPLPISWAAPCWPRRTPSPPARPMRPICSPAPGGKGPIKGKQHPPRLPGACMAVRRMPGYRLRYRRRRGQAHVRLPDPADVGRAIYQGQVSRRERIETFLGGHLPHPPAAQGHLQSPGYL